MNGNFAHPLRSQAAAWLLALGLALGLGGVSTARATTSLDLGQYTVVSNIALPVLGGLGLEASAVTYARDRNSLFVVGDE